MNARVTTVQVQPGKWEEAIGIYRDHVIPAAQSQQGFRGAQLLTNRTTGQGLSVTMWDSEADMVAGEASGYFQEQLARFKDIFTAPPAREQYEVSAQA